MSWGGRQSRASWVLFLEFTAFFVGFNNIMRSVRLETRHGFGRLQTLYFIQMEIKLYFRLLKLSKKNVMIKRVFLFLYLKTN
jgi:hypothetical protein